MRHQRRTQARAASGENVLEMTIGREVRASRSRLGITVVDLAQASGVSIGMLSKIENGAISPSLGTLQSLSKALGVPVTCFFRRYEEQRDAVFQKSGCGQDIERRGTRVGHRYQLLGELGGTCNKIALEPFMITLNEGSEVFPAFQHAGLEFIYMIEGEMRYRHGDKVYALRPGDSLYFDANAPHGPEKLIEQPIRFLSVTAYSRDDA